MRVYCLLALLPAASLALTFFGASDVHFGHDVRAQDNSTTTALELNIAAVKEMNSLPNNGSWPEGDTVQTPVGLIITGDLVDNGYTEGYEVSNFTNVYGLTGEDGLVHFPVYESRGNHDGGNTSDTEPHFVASMIVERNQIRKSIPSFNITNVSSTTGLHYSWQWSVSSTCRVHFFALNEYAGHVCDGCAPNNCFYGPPCYTGWTYPEDSLGFLEATLPNVVKIGEPVFVTMHYCFDGYSDTWWSQNQRAELFETLKAYNVAGILCGHTHSAAIYSWNGTAQVPFGTPNSIDIYNIPSTQKEDANGYPAPSEYMVFDIAQDAGATTATFRAAQRVAYNWGTVAQTKKIACQ